VGYELSSAENSRLLSQIFIMRFWAGNNSGVREISHQTIDKWFLFKVWRC
jgi:hypothetical protein